MLPASGVMIGNVYLHDWPQDDTNNANLVAPLGAIVEILAEFGDWYKVRVYPAEKPGAALTGWVPKRWVTIVKPVPSNRITPIPDP